MRCQLSPRNPQCCQPDGVNRPAPQRPPERRRCLDELDHGRSAEGHPADSNRVKLMARRQSTTAQSRSFDARLIKQARGYTAYVAQLPGVVSEGGDAAEALTNIREAFIAVIKTYEDEGMPIPWRGPEPLAQDECQFRFAVHV